MIIDLLSKPRIRPAWIPRILCGQNRWKVLSGRWQAQDSREVLYLFGSGPATCENIALIGSPRWTDYSFETTLSILNDSAHPPEGGAILYYHFENPRNYYSLHVCIAKKRLEVVKRIHGKWVTIEGQEFPVEKQRFCRISVATHEGCDRVTIDGQTRFEFRKDDITRGCVGIGAKHCSLLIGEASVTLRHSGLTGSGSPQS